MLTKEPILRLLAYINLSTVFSILYISYLKTAISDSDVIALDDRKNEHPYGKKLTFI